MDNFFPQLHYHKYLSTFRLPTQIMFCCQAVTKVTNSVINQVGMGLLGYMRGNFFVKYQTLGGCWLSRIF